MPTGRGKKAAKSAPRAPDEQAMCPDMEDFLGDSDIEDSQGISPKYFSFLFLVWCVLQCLRVLVERGNTSKDLE